MKVDRPHTGQAFLYPIISRCLELQAAGAPPGVVAVIVYPMNALAEDQLERLRGLLAGRGVPFGMYVGKTPTEESQIRGERMPAGSTNAAFSERLRQISETGQRITLLPPEERASRRAMRAEGGQPRILLTNVKQHELLLTRGWRRRLRRAALRSHARRLGAPRASVRTLGRGAERGAGASETLPRGLRVFVRGLPADVSQPLLSRIPGSPRRGARTRSSSRPARGAAPDPGEAAEDGIDDGTGPDLDRGRSMEPAIPDGAWCLFRSPVEGTRQGKTVLVQRDATDPETGQRYTVKRYRSQKTTDGDTWRHETIRLEPVNPDFDPIVLRGMDDREVKVVAELVEVLSAEWDRTK